MPNGSPTSRSISELLPPVRQALEEQGKIVFEHEPEITDQVVIGIKHAHAKASVIDRHIHDQEFLLAHFQHQSSTKRACENVLKVAQPQALFICEGQPTALSDWSARDLNWFSTIADLETSLFSLLEANPEASLGYYQQISNFVRGGNPELAERARLYLDGAYRHIASCLRQGYRRVCGHNRLETYPQLISEELQSGNIEGRQGRLGTIHAQFYDVTHKGICDSIQQFANAGDIVVACEGSEHFSSGSRLLAMPECEGKHLEDYLKKIRNTLVLVLEPHGTKEVMEGVRRHPG